MQTPCLVFLLNENIVYYHESWSGEWRDLLPLKSSYHTLSRDVWTSLFQYLLPTDERYNENQLLPKLLLSIWTYFCSVAPLLTQRLPKIESLWVKREFIQPEQEPLSCIIIAKNAHLKNCSSSLHSREQGELSPAQNLTRNSVSYFFWAIFWGIYIVL